MLSEVIKRNGKKEAFDLEKIARSIFQAARSVGGKDQRRAAKLADKVKDYLAQHYPRQKKLTTFLIGEAVEKVLIEEGHAQTAKAFILYRYRQAGEEEKKKSLGVADDWGGLTYNSLWLLQSRYLRRNQKGQTIETPRQMLKRVARFAAAAEKKKKQAFWEKKFFQLMWEKKFLPGTRTLANAGKKFPQLANCFVFPLEDSIEGIFKILYQSSVIKKHGGGCGFNFSSLRPAGDLVGGEPGLAAGPGKIIELFDLTTRIFRQQGRYESGNMAVLDVDHPDILKFITLKEKEGYLISTNISLAVSDDFMKAVEKDQDWALRNPRTGEVVEKIKAKMIFDLAANYAHRTGDPGLLFLDTINRNNPLRRHWGEIKATNPCGEQPLYPYESCNLGYLNLPQFLRFEKKKVVFDFNALAEATKIAVRMLDDLIDQSWFPVAEIQEQVRQLRRTGLGVVGWAETLARLKIPYHSEEGFKTAEKVMKTIHDSAWEESFALGEEKGPFPAVGQSRWHKQRRQPRNVALTTCPPSSNHGIIFNTSFGIEPFFALVYRRRIYGGEVELLETNSFLKEQLQERGLYREELIQKIAANHGSLQGIKEIPTDLREIFPVAHDIHFRAHLKMQAAFQKWVDNSVTKTINLPFEATVNDVAGAYFLAWKLGCKGITIFRDQSRREQVIYFGAQ